MNASNKEVLDESTIAIRKAKITAEQDALGINKVIRAILSGNEIEAANLVKIQTTTEEDLFDKERLNYKNAVEYAIDARMTEVITAITERVGDKKMSPYKKRIQEEMGGLGYLMNKSKQEHCPKLHPLAKAIE
jgi:hypothetical protein